MRLPEFPLLGGTLGEFRRANCQLTAGQRAMTKDVRKPITKLVTQVDDPIVRCTAVRAGVAAIFNQRDRRIRRAKDMVVIRIDRRIEPGITQACRQRRSLHVRIQRWNQGPGSAVPYP